MRHRHRGGREDRTTPRAQDKVALCEGRRATMLRCAVGDHTATGISLTLARPANADILF